MRLIDSDAVLDALREVIVPAEDIGFGDELTDGYNDGIDMAVTVVSGLHPVDAVEVVRCDGEKPDCGNCRHADRMPGVYPCSQCEQRYSDLPTMWEPKEVDNEKTD